MSQVIPIPAAGTAGLIALLIAHDLGAPEAVVAGISIVVAAFVFVGWFWSDSLPNGGGV